MPFFSVYIPVFNGERYIAEAVASVLEQSFRDFELVVVNDGSTDATERIVARLAASDSRIRVVTQKNTGLFHARITAFQCASGRYLVALDADDRLKRNALRRLREIIGRSPGVDMVKYCLERTDFATFCEKTSKREMYVEGQDIVPFQQRYLSLEGDYSQCTTAIRTAVVQDCDEISKYPRISIGEDFVHTLNYILKVRSAYILNEILYEYRYTSDSMTNSFHATCVDDFSFRCQLLHKKKLEAKFPVNEEELIRKYARETAKILLYHPSRLDKTGGRREYYAALEKLRALPEISTYYNCRGVSFIYSLPLRLLKYRFDFTLYLMKRIMYRVRLFRDKHLQ